MQILTKFTLLISLYFGATALLQAQTESIIVVNGGIYGTTNYANTTIELLNSQNPVNMGTVGTTSIQDIVVDGEYAYIAAQDSIVKYNWLNKTKVAANAFDAPSTLSLAMHGNHLLVGNWYAPWGWTGAYNKHFLIYDASNLSLVDSIPQVTKPADDFVVVGDYAYIAQNNDKTLGFGDTLGYLAVVDLNTLSLVRYDTLSTNGDEVGRLVVEGDMIYSINKASNTISSYNTVTLAKSTQPSAAGVNLKTASYGPTAFSKGAGVWYFPFDSGIGSYNLSTNTIVMPNIVNITGSFAFVMDTFNNTFCVSHINYSDQTQNKGRIYDMNGDSVGMFQVGYSPEALAIVSTTVLGMDVTVAQEDELTYTLFPNPATTTLQIALNQEEAVNVMVINSMGQTVLNQTATGSVIELAIEELSAGTYFVAVVNEKGIMRAQPFVKK